MGKGMPKSLRLRRSSTNMTRTNWKRRRIIRLSIRTIFLIRLRKNLLSIWFKTRIKSRIKAKKQLQKQRGDDYLFLNHLLVIYIYY